MTRSRHPRVWVVVVHYGPLAVTLRALRALDRLTSPALTVVLADNSGHGEALRPGLVAVRRPVRILALGRNAGFARAVNRGIQAALAGGADAVWLLNNDAVPEPGALDPLVRAMFGDPDTAATGSRIHDNGRPRRMWHAGGEIDPATGFTRHRGAGEVDRGQWNESAEVDYVSGCSMLLRAETLRAIGPLDERFIMYYEETDWCARATRAGWNIRYVPTSRVRHDVAGREGAGELGWMRLMVRNQLYFLYKHHRSSWVPAALRVFRWPVASSLWRGRPDGAWLGLRGLFGFLAMLPGLSFRKSS
jgi:GT2 family glycosyltransferase